MAERYRPFPHVFMNLCLYCMDGMEMPNKDLAWYFQLLTSFLSARCVSIERLRRRPDARGKAMSA